jgi:arginyl-tRNA synthetase
VITGDLDRALATPVSSAGTWRPAPAGSGGAPGTYATTVAFLLARQGGAAPAIAAALARRLGELEWVGAAVVTGGGYLTVTVTDDALARLAVRITRTGPGCARSGALAAAAETAPAQAGLACALTWDEARQGLAATALGRLAEAAGARVTWTHATERMAAPGSPADRAAGPVAEAIAFAGADAVVYTLACLPPGGPVRLDPLLVAAHDLRNPAYAVRYAHAHAASTLRQAADLGLGMGDAAGFQPWPLAHPSERALLYELSWLPERVAGAARRRRLDVLARYLEGLAGAYLACQQARPAVRPGDEQDCGPSGVAVTGTPVGGPPGAVGPRPGARAGREAAVARLWLAAAARTALRAGLDLLGVGAPDRM